MRVIVCLIAALCATIAIVPADALSALSFTPTLPSGNPFGVLFYRDDLTVLSTWDAQPVSSQAQIRIVDPAGTQTITPASSCAGSPPVCTTTYTMSQSPLAAIAADLNFTYMATPSTNLVPNTWCFLAKGVCVDPSLSTADTSFSLIYHVSLQSVTMYSNHPLPGVAIVGSTVFVKYTFNTPMLSVRLPGPASGGINCTINGGFASKVVNRYDITCSRVIASGDLGSSTSKPVSFWGSSQQFISTGFVPCTFGLCAGTPLITATSDSSAVTMYAFTPLAMTVVSIASNNPDLTKAQVGDSIYLYLQFNQAVDITAIDANAVTIMGHQVPVLSETESRFLCVYTVAPTDVSGVATFRITSSAFTANNQACSAGLCSSPTVSESQTTDASQVVVTVCAGAANIGNHVLSSVSAGKQVCLSQCT